MEDSVVAIAGGNVKFIAKYCYGCQRLAHSVAQGGLAQAV